MRFPRTRLATCLPADDSRTPSFVRWALTPVIPMRFGDFTGQEIDAAVFAAGRGTRQVRGRP